MYRTVCASSKLLNFFAKCGGSTKKRDQVTLGTKAILGEMVVLKGFNDYMYLLILSLPTRVILWPEAEQQQQQQQQQQQLEVGPTCTWVKVQNFQNHNL